MISLIAYVTTAIVFFAIDMVWLGVVAKSFYFTKLEGLIKDSPDMLVAGGFYLFFVIGLVFFAVKPALDANSLKTALIYGALFGLFTYATYDLTNLATLKNWPVSVTIVDIIWGGVISGVSSVAGYQLTKMIADKLL
ncbi:MAG: DUF2177 family protein [Pseudobdellovibrionaceae bacterium]